MKKLLALLLASAMTVACFASCGGKDPGGSESGNEEAKTYTYNDYITVTPSTWNELDSTDSNNDAIMSYISSSFFEYDYKFEDGKKFNDDGSINADGIVAGGFEVKYSAATALKDVTSKYGEAWGLSADQIADGGYIWQITLRDDLKWDDGTPIHADDFVYTMQQQLSPDFKFARADTYYNNAVKLKNAKQYFYQGQSGMFAAVDVLGGSISSFDGLYFDATNVSAFTDIFGTSDMTSLSAYKTYFQVGDVNVYDDLVGYAGADRVPMTQEIADKLASLFGENGQLGAYWGWADEEIGYFTVCEYTYPSVDFEDVGIFNDGDYDLVIVCDDPMQFFKEDGSLSYLAAYNLQSLPLVKKDLFEKCKVAPTEGTSVYTSTYNTSLETSASWGPYKLTYFQAGKQFILEKNDKWYGFGLEDKKGLYQTEKIVTEVIATEEAQQLAFWKGEVESLGISVTIADDYKDSKYAVYSPRIAAFGINIYSGLDNLKKQGRNNGVLAIKEFREAMSLTLDRVDYNKKLSTANIPNYGLISDDYYYDVENSGVYRYTDQAKEALLRAYGYSLNEDGKWTDGVTVYASLEKAVDALTGLNVQLAKQKLEEAYTELTSKAEYYGYDASKKIQICVGQSEDNESSNRVYNWINDWLTNMVAGTSFEGKIEVTKNFTLGSKWSEEFKAGNYDICTGGIGNAPFDPFYLIGGWIGIMDSVNFHPYWDVDHIKKEYTLPVVDGFAQSGQTLELTITDWYNSLNGNMSEGASYNWKNAPVEVRLDILAMLEEYGLTQYYTLPTSRGMTASLHSAKWHYISDDYNTMMGFGGIEYIQYDYDDAAWDDFVKANGSDLREFYKG